MARLAGVDSPRDKRVEIALTYIYGVGRTRSVQVLEETKIDTLRRFEDDVPEVRTGFECGIRLGDTGSGMEEGDIIEIFERQRVR